MMKKQLEPQFYIDKFATLLIYEGTNHNPS